MSEYENIKGFRTSRVGLILAFNQSQMTWAPSQQHPRFLRTCMCSSCHPSVLNVDFFLFFFFFAVFTQWLQPHSDHWYFGLKAHSRYSYFQGRCIENRSGWLVTMNMSVKGCFYLHIGPVMNWRLVPLVRSMMLGKVPQR